MLTTFLYRLGMRSGELYEITMSTQSVLCLVESHVHHSVHGVAVNHANIDEFVTAGDDG